MASAPLAEPSLKGELRGSSAPVSPRSASLMLERPDAVAVRRALLSVSDKAGIADFAAGLVAHGVELLSTGSTARQLRGSGLAVREVSDYTGFPELMDGRLKTLHPKVHGGLLGRRGVDDAAMRERGILPIDMVVVNLYPFGDTVARPDCRFDDAVENIDIGGPAMLRAAAKNHADVAAVADPADYERLLAELAANAGRLGAACRFALARQAFAHTAAYDAAIANYFVARQDAPPHEPVSDGALPARWQMSWRRAATLRYGENAQQRAALYVADDGPVAGTLAAAELLQGKALSYNNLADADAALACVRDFPEPACAIVKHANPCGVAVSEAGPLAAYEGAYACDPSSAFGGVIAFNRTLDEATAREIMDRQFVEVILAPDIAEGARAALAAKPKLRVLRCGEAPGGPSSAQAWPLALRSVDGGLLVQDRDSSAPAGEALRVVTRRKPSAREQADLLFAWRVAAHVKSNAIVYARDGRTVGIGAGQMSRVFSVRIAALKAGDAQLDLSGSALASDAFFPFRDGVDEAARSGASAVIQPGGSVRDQEVIDAADERDIAMVFTACRHFRH